MDYVYLTECFENYKSSSLIKKLKHSFVKLFFY